MTRLLLLLLTAVPGIAMAQTAVPVSPEEIIVQHVDEEYGRAIELLEKSVIVNSGTMNFEGVRQVGDIFREEFDALGFSTEWVEGAPFGRAGHLVAVRAAGGPKLLLIGHLDTVFPADSPFREFEIVDEHFAKGPGTTDMKGGNVIMIQALRALRAAGLLDEVSITAVLTGEEEKSGKPLSLSKAALIDAATWADYAIGFEDGDGNPETAVISRRGSTDWDLTVTGRPAHSSQIFKPDYGYGAIYEAARILNLFRRQLSRMENLTFNPGFIVGGTETSHDADASTGTAFGKTNVIAESVHVRGDIRAITPEQLEKAQDRMREIVADHLTLTDASIVFGEGYPPMAPDDGNRALLEMFDGISQELGLGAVRAVDPRNAGAADISFAAEHVEMAMDGVGLMGSGGHTVDEVADLRTLPQQTKRVAVLMYRLSQLQ